MSTRSHIQPLLAIDRGLRGLKVQGTGHCLVYQRPDAQREGPVNASKPFFKPHAPEQAPYHCQAQLRQFVTTRLGRLKIIRDVTAQQ